MPVWQYSFVPVWPILLYAYVANTILCACVAKADSVPVWL